MIDWTVPEGLSPAEHQQWLREKGAQVVAETGQPTGQMELPDIEGQPSFVMWWTDEDYTGAYRPRADSQEEPTE